MFCVLVYTNTEQTIDSDHDATNHIVMEQDAVDNLSEALGRIGVVTNVLATEQSAGDARAAMR